MKSTWFWMVLAACVGTGLAWAVNYQRFGHRTGRMGPFTMNGDVTPEQAIALVNRGSVTNEGATSKLARVEIVGDTTFDFGAMSPNSEGEHKFLVKSVGEGELRLRLGATTCKCTLGELENETLGPGEQTEITLSWKVREDETEFSQSAQLITNDPENVAVTLRITGKVVGDMEIVPEEWTFGEVATGEPAEVQGVIYSYLESKVVPHSTRFSSDEMNALADIQVEEFTPSQEDGIRSNARQGFRVTATIAPGLRQGALSQNFVFAFERKGEDGNPIPLEEGDDDPYDYVYVPVKGRIVGPLSLLPNSRITGSPGGGFIYDLGRIEADASHQFKTFVVLKGNERNNVNLSVGEVVPEGAIRATLGEPKGRGSMVLYPLDIELIRGDKPIERLGKNRDDYGSIWIDSDNPKVAKMRIALKFAIEGR